MSDTSVTPETENLETEAVAIEATPAQSNDTPRVREDRKGGDRKPRSRDRGGMREEEKEFREEMIAIDRVTRVTA
jgi:hypothetical protein